MRLAGHHRFDMISEPVFRMQSAVKDRPRRSMSLGDLFVRPDLIVIIVRDEGDDDLVRFGDLDRFPGSGVPAIPVSRQE